MHLRGGHCRHREQASEEPQEEGRLEGRRHRRWQPGRVSLLRWVGQPCQPFQLQESPQEM